jgi:hypothetical protein
MPESKSGALTNLATPLEKQRLCRYFLGEKMKNSKICTETALACSLFSKPAPALHNFYARQTV